MIRRTSIIFLEFLAGLVAGGVIMVLAGAWWLSSGPVPLTFLTPYIEHALSPDDSTIVVEIEQTELQWAGWDRAADLHVSDVRILDIERRIIAELPHVTLGLSLRAMLRGRIAPTYFEILRPSVSAIRNDDGSFTIGLSKTIDKSGQKAERENIVLERLIAELLSEPDVSRPLGYLKRVSIVEGDLYVDDRMLKRVWNAPRANIDLERNNIGMSAIADIDLELEGKTSRVTSNAVYATETGTIDATLNFSGFDPAPILRSLDYSGAQHLAELKVHLEGSLGLRMKSDGAVRAIRFEIGSDMGAVSGEVAIGEDGYGVSAGLAVTQLRPAVLTAVVPDLAEFASIDVPIDGRFTLSGATDGTVQSLVFDLHSGPGVVALPQIYSQPLPVKGTRLLGEVADNLRQIRIEEAVITLEEGEVKARATLTKVGGDMNLRLDGSVSHISAPLLPRYWPPDLAKDARDWVLSHIRKGRVEEANMSVVARFPDGEVQNVEIESLNGTIRLRDVEVDYFPPLTPVRGVDADMTFTDNRFDIAVSDGRIQELLVDEGSVVITGLAGEDQDISIDLIVRGPLVSALSILDSEPLRFVSDLGIDATSISGEAAARLVFDFPLLKTLKVEQVAVAAGATLRNVAMKNGPYGIALSDAALELQLTGAGMTVSGDAALNSAPVKLAWQENFSGTETFERRFTLSGILNSEQRRKLRLDKVPNVGGDISGEVTYTVFPGGRSETVSKIDLLAATLDIPLIRWRKPSNVPGNVYLFARTSPDGATVVEDLRLEAADLRLSARVELADNLEDIRLFEFRNLEFSGNKMQGRVLVAADDGLDVDLTGERIDIAPFLNGGDEVDAPALEQNEPLRIRARFDEVLLGDGRWLKDVKSALRSDGSRWRQISIDAGVDENIRLSVQFVPKGDGATLLISTSDAGLALQAANWTGRLKGGVLRVTGVQTAPGAPIIGEFKVKEFNVTDAPALARVLQVLSLTGIFSALSQEGLDFVTLDGSFRYYGGALEIKNARALGSSIGITAEGTVYIGEETADLTGTVVPAYTLNSALGNIPIVGKWLTGGKNEGLFAANYVVKGRLENPNVTVNPLSAFAPGFLRNLIGGQAKPLTGEDALTPSQ